MEIYKDVDGYNGDYQVSNYGNVKSKKRKIHKILILNKDKFGYLRIQLNSKYKLVHRLVAETFIAKIPNGYVVNHLDSNPQNNKLSNLQICTQAENVRHTHKLGRAKMPDNSGQRNGMSKLTIEDVRLIRTLADIKIPQKKIAEMFGVTPQNISDIKCGRVWKNCV